MELALRISDRIILSHLADEESASAAEISEREVLPARAVERGLRRLRKVGLVTVHTSNEGPSLWSLSERGHAFLRRAHG